MSERPTTQPSATARRIAREHNAAIAQGLAGGLLTFDAIGRGGEWYSAGSRPPATLIFALANRRVTSHDVQDWLDAVARDDGREEAT